MDSSQTAGVVIDGVEFGGNCRAEIQLGESTALEGAKPNRRLALKEGVSWECHCRIARAGSLPHCDQLPLPIMFR